MSEPTPLLAPVQPRQVQPRLWRDGRFVDDPWISIGDDDPLPVGGHALVSLARWRSDRATLSALGAALGLRLAVDDQFDPSAEEVGRLAIITLPFPKFSDGRSYSKARRLRDAGFNGEIRATGDVLLDQLPLMLRSGFDAFQIVNAATVKVLESNAVPAVTRVYQSGSEAGQAGWLSRRSTKPACTS